jgi:hypothetical protein
MTSISMRSACRLVMAAPIALCAGSAHAANDWTTARAIYAVGAGALLPDVATAFSKEEDDEAALEELRTLLALGAPSSEATAIDAARRLPAIRRQAGRALARAKVS